MGAYENSPKEQGLYSEFNPMHLSSNRQDDTSQHVTSSPQKQLEKARRKAEAKNNWYAEATTQSGSQSIAIHSSKVITKTSLDQAGMIQQLAQNQAEAKLLEQRSQANQLATNYSQKHRIYAQAQAHFVKKLIKQLNPRQLSSNS